MAREQTVFGYTDADTDPTLTPGEDVQDVVAKNIRDRYAGSSAIVLRENPEHTDMHPQQVRDELEGPFDVKDTKPNIRPDAQDLPAHSIIKDGRHTNVGALDGTSRFASPSEKHQTTSAIGTRRQIR